MTTLEQRGVVRLRYRSRQRLASDDLRREVVDPTELQWWHNRALHDGFGVVQGLQVRAIQGVAGPRIEVAPGQAYDGYGRPLIVEVPLTTDIPQPARGRLPGGVLILRARREDPWAAPELCWADGPVRDGVPLACLVAVPIATLPALQGPLPERVAYQETPAALLALGRLSEGDLDVALAASSDASWTTAVAALFASSQTCPWPRRSRRVARSRVVSGATIPRRTPWQPWLIRAPIWLVAQRAGTAEEIQIGFRVRIDTKAAGFTETPRYFAWLQGPLFTTPVTGDPSRGVHWDHLEDVGPDGFTFLTSLITTTTASAALKRDSFERPPGGTASDLLRELRDGEYSVSWLAILPAEDAPCGPAEQPTDPCADRRHDPCRDEVRHGHDH